MNWSCTVASARPSVRSACLSKAVGKQRIEAWPVMMSTCLGFGFGFGLGLGLGLG